MDEGRWAMSEIKKYFAENIYFSGKHFSKVPATL